MPHIRLSFHMENSKLELQEKVPVSKLRQQIMTFSKKLKIHSGAPEESSKPHTQPPNLQPQLPSSTGNV